MLHAQVELSKIEKDFQFRSGVADVGERRQEHTMTICYLTKLCFCMPQVMGSREMEVTGSGQNEESTNLFLEFIQMFSDTIAKTL